MAPGLARPGGAEDGPRGVVGHHADVDRRHREPADVAAAARHVQLVDRGRARAGRLAQLPEQPAGGLALVARCRRPPARPAGRWPRSGASRRRARSRPAPRVPRRPRRDRSPAVSHQPCSAFLGFQRRVIPSEARDLSAALEPSRARSMAPLGMTVSSCLPKLGRPRGPSDRVRPRREAPARGARLVARAGPWPRR